MDPSLQYLPINKLARDKIIRRVESSKRLVKIMRGLDREETKNEQLAANLLFSSPLEKFNAKDINGKKAIAILPPTKKNYEKLLGLLDHKNMSESIHSALDNVYKYDSEFKRCEEGGMNLATIMTEYRRKQLMEALLHENQSDDPYEGRDKLKIFLATHHPELLNNENNQKGKDDSIDNSELTIKLETYKKKKENKKLHSKINSNRNNNEFIPQWNAYDTMKNRWQYIRPQLKQLKHENDTYAPTDASRSYVLKEDGMKIASNYQDALIWSERSYQSVKKMNSTSTVSSKR